MQMGVNLNKDGTVTLQRSIATSSGLIEKRQIEKSKEDDRKKGFEIKDNSDGYVATKTYADILDVVNDGGNLWNPDENFNGVQVRKGLLYDYYSLDLFIKGQKYDIPKSNYQANIPSYFSPNVKMNIWQYNEYRQNAEAQTEEMNQMTDQATRAAIDSLKMNFTFNIPYPVDNTNADNKMNEGKTLTWNLKPAFMDNTDITLQAQFKIYHESTIVGLIVVGVILLIVTIILVFVGIIKKDNPKRRNVLFGIAGLILILIASFAGYAKYSIDNPPKLTAGDRILEKDVKDSNGKPLADTLKNEKSIPVNSIEEVAATLKSKEINGTISSVSVKDEAGFLALLNVDAKLFFAIYDAKDSSIAMVPYSSKTLNFRANTVTFHDGKKYYNPLIFNMEIFDDNKDSQDNKLGVWNGTKHIFPIYAIFKVDDTGKINPGMLTSGSGLKPSHYHSPLKEQRNVNLANVLLTHMDSLKRDIKERNINLPNDGQ